MPITLNSSRPWNSPWPADSRAPSHARTGPPRPAPRRRRSCRARSPGCPPQRARDGLRRVVKAPDLGADRDAERCERQHRHDPGRGPTCARSSPTSSTTSAPTASTTSGDSASQSICGPCGSAATMTPAWCVAVRTTLMDSSRTARRPPIHGPGHRPQPARRSSDARPPAPAPARPRRPRSSASAEGRTAGRRRARG